MIHLAGKEDDELTLENADEACQSHTQAGDDWHLCLKEEVEDHWAEFMDKSEGAYGFRAWLQQKGFSEGGCIYNGRRSEATKDEPYWACGYPKGKKFNALCCVDMPNVAVRHGWEGIALYDDSNSIILKHDGVTDISIWGSWDLAGW